MISADNYNACTCGNIVKDGNTNDPPHPIPTQNNDNHLGASFVHLSPPSPGECKKGIDCHIEQESTTDEGGLFNQGILNSYRHITTLLKVAESQLEFCSEEHNSEEVCLCSNCVERIASAIEDNTMLLEADIEAYDKATKREEEKQRRLIKALSINAGMIDDTQDTDDDSLKRDENSILQNALETLEYELQRMQITHQEHVVELEKVNELIEEQALVSQALTAQEDEVLTEFNSLEIEARVFQDIHRHLTHRCHAAEREKFHLSRVQLHSTLFNIGVDERCMRYPLINNLRLAHKPKGISWLEINAAWSQAAQLLMFVSSTIKFKSKDLRIVPLMSCAKIIEVGSNGETVVVNHLGVDVQTMDRKTHNAKHIIPSIRAFYSLLYQMHTHITHSNVVESIGKPPFELELNIIGSNDFTRLNESDDVGWSSTLHCVASYMKWISRIACKYIHQPNRA